MLPRSISSRERLFSEEETDADWERGDGRVRRGGAADDDEEAVGAAMPLTVLLDEEVAVVGRDSDGRVLVAVEVEAKLDAEPVRRWGCLKGLGVEVEEEDGALVVGAGELRADPAWEPLELECALWLEMVRWRCVWLLEELTEDEEPEASGRAYGGYGSWVVSCCW